MVLSKVFDHTERLRPHIPDEVVELDHEDHYSDTARIKGLSDGVFSIAMTLLAFSLLSSIPAQPLTAASFARLFATPLLVYAMTFIILGTYWIAHSIQFHYVVRSDRPLMVRTVLFLLFVSIVPFSTAYLGHFIFDTMAIAVYCANLAFCGVALNGTLLYATKDPMMLHRVFDRRVFRGIRISLILGPLLYVLAFVLSFAYPMWAFALCVAVPIFTFFPNPFWGRAWRWVTRNAGDAAD